MLSVGVEPGSGIRMSSPPSLSSVPTQISVETPPNPAAGAGVWESLDEVSAVAAGDTGRSGRTVPESRSNRFRAPASGTAPRPRRRMPLLLAVGALVVLVGGGVGAYFAFIRPRPSDTTATQPTNNGTKRLIVSKSKGEGAFPTLAAAVARASVGDTIAVEEPTLTESLIRVGRRDITIESALPEGRPVALNLSTNTHGTAVIEVTHGAEGFRLRGFVIDAQGGADFAVQMSGNVAGATLENVSVQGGKKGGVRLYNPAGQPGRPILLERVRVVVGAGQDAGVKVETQGNLTARALAVRNSRFEGPGHAGIRFEGPADAVEVTGNRFYQLDAAISAARPGERQSLKINVAQNTIADCKVGLLVNGPANGAPAVALTVNRNYFARVSEAVGRTEGDLPGVTATQNGRAPGTPTGNLNVNPAEVNPAPDFSTNRADDPAFLRFLPGAAPTVDGQRVGAE
jgi:hypothetical protein